MDASDSARRRRGPAADQCDYAESIGTWERRNDMTGATTRTLLRVLLAGRLGVFGGADRPFDPRAGRWRDRGRGRTRVRCPERRGGGGEPAVAADHGQRAEVLRHPVGRLWHRAALTRELWRVSDPRLWRSCRRPSAWWRTVKRCSPPHSGRPP